MSDPLTDDESHSPVNKPTCVDVTTTQTPPSTVQYCGVCGLPPEYCCFGERWNECKEWIIANYRFGDRTTGDRTKEDLLSEWEQVFDKENRKRQKNASDAAAKESKDLAEAKAVTIIVNNRGKKRFVTEIHGLHNWTDDLKSACSLVKKKFACSATLTGGSMKERKGERNKKKQDRFLEREKERENRRKKKNGIKVDDNPSDDSDDDESDSKQKKKGGANEPPEFIEAQGDISADLSKLLEKEFNIPANFITVTKK